MLEGKIPTVCFGHTGSATLPQRAIREVFSGHCLVTVGAGFKIRRHNIVLDPFSSLKVFLTAACTAHSCSCWNKSWFLLGWDKYMKRGLISLGKRDQHFNVSLKEKYFNLKSCSWDIWHQLYLYCTHKTFLVQTENIWIISDKEDVR